jgi:hypothetical protein
MARGPAMKDDGNDEKNRSDEKYPSRCSHASQNPERLLTPRGDYQTLLSFQKAEVVYDLTFRFCHKFLAKGDRTVDQMIQSALFGKEEHSGRQQGSAHFKGDRDQTHKRRPRQPGGVAG